MVKELLDSDAFEKVLVLGRRIVDEPNNNKLEQVVVDFDKIEDYAQVCQGYDVGISCLGTTRKDAGSAEQFIKIDYHYSFNFAKMLKGVGTKHFLLLTSTGADANSFLLYPQTKGKLENDIKALGFDKLSIFRPALLTFDANEARPRTRFFEGLAIHFVNTFGITTGTKNTTLLAQFMRKISENQSNGVHVYENNAIVL